MRDGIWVEDEAGTPAYIAYEDIDPDLLPKLFKPIGGFCFPVETFVRLRLPPVPFFIHNWLPRPGKMILYAPAKAGKSYVTYQMARCIGAGVPFLEIPTTQGRVLLSSSNLGHLSFKSGFGKQGRITRMFLLAQPLP